MKDLVTGILTDRNLRDVNAIEQTLMQQAVATPWSSRSLSIQNDAPAL
jgi:hypothetical protein